MHAAQRGRPGRQPPLLALTRCRARSAVRARTPPRACGSTGWPCWPRACRPARAQSAPCAWCAAGGAPKVAAAAWRGCCVLHGAGTAWDMGLCHPPALHLVLAAVEEVAELSGVEAGRLALADDVLLGVLHSAAGLACGWRSSEPALGLAGCGCGLQQQQPTSTCLVTTAVLRATSCLVRSSTARVAMMLLGCGCASGRAELLGLADAAGGVLPATAAWCGLSQLQSGNPVAGVNADGSSSLARVSEPWLRAQSQVGGWPRQQ